MIELKNVSFSYPAVQVFRDFDIVFEENTVNCVLGPSGCGKSTLLNLLSGDIEPQGGTVENAGKKISYVFQSPRLIPQITVFKNLELVLKSVVPNKEERRKIVADTLALLGLDGTLEMYPAQLSGGMAQRVALARAFVFPSKLLLMDEPFKGLDPALKTSVMKAFLALFEREKRTVVFVTHDIDEAVLLGDKIFMLSDKPAKVIKELQIAAPQSDRKVYDRELGEIKNEIYKVSEGEALEKA